MNPIGHVAEAWCSCIDVVVHENVGRHVDILAQQQRRRLIIITTTTTRHVQFPIHVLNDIPVPGETTRVRALPGKEAVDEYCGGRAVGVVPNRSRHGEDSLDGGRDGTTVHADIVRAEDQEPCCCCGRRAPGCCELREQRLYTVQHVIRTIARRSPNQHCCVTTTSTECLFQHGSIVGRFRYGMAQVLSAE